jgi:hypothetical protein
MTLQQHTLLSQDIINMSYRIRDNIINEIERRFIEEDLIGRNSSTIFNDVRRLSFLEIDDKDNIRITEGK